MITPSDAVVYTGRVPATYPTTTQFGRPGVLPCRKASTQHIHLWWRVQGETPCPASRHEIPTLQTTIVRLGSWPSVKEPAPHHRLQSGTQPQTRHHAARCVCPLRIHHVPAVYPPRTRAVAVEGPMSPIRCNPLPPAPFLSRLSKLLFATLSVCDNELVAGPRGRPSVSLEPLPMLETTVSHQGLQPLRTRLAWFGIGCTGQIGVPGF